MKPDTQVPSPDARVTRPGGRTARNRDLVLAAVASLLLEAGYDALTVDAVAARSGIHRTTVYRRWRDTGGLLADSLEAAREQAWEPPDTGSLLGDLTRINEQIAGALTTEPSIVRALIAASFRSPAAASALRSFWEDRFALAAVVVERAVARREAGADTDARTLLVGSCAPVFYELALMRGPAPGDLAARYARQAATSARPETARPETAP